VFNLNSGDTYTITAPLYNGNKNKQNISFMFVVNDAEAAKTLPQITETLGSAKANATFFISGMFVANNLELTKNIASKFELGNYGFTGKKLNITDKNKIKDEIVFCHNIVKSVTDNDMNLFTPPGMFYNKTTLSASDDLGYKMILPTVRPATIDWSAADRNLVKSYATANVSAGDIILLYPTEATKNVLAEIISYFLERNFFIVSVGKNIVE
jgi:peptidoglycan/xylan/chitin deacetylase (PgdA/CDA1 family)